jgi:hypothetical protein
VPLSASRLMRVNLPPPYGTVTLLSFTTRPRVGPGKKYLPPPSHCTRTHRALGVPQVYFLVLLQPVTRTTTVHVHLFNMNAMLCHSYYLVTKAAAVATQHSVSHPSYRWDILGMQK